MTIVFVNGAFVEVDPTAADELIMLRARVAELEFLLSGNVAQIRADHESMKEADARVAELESTNQMYSEMLDKAHDDRDAAEIGKTIFKNRVAELEAAVWAWALSSNKQDADQKLLDFISPKP